MICFSPVLGLNVLTLLAAFPRLSREPAPVSP
jgi:hypothetical protein